MIFVVMIFAKRESQVDNGSRGSRGLSDSEMECSSWGGGERTVFNGEMTGDVGEDDDGVIGLYAYGGGSLDIRFGKGSIGMRGAFDSCS